MNYKTLRKLYYGDKEVYKNTFNERYNYSTSVKLDFEVNNKSVFFTQSNDVINLMFKILRLDKKIRTLCEALPGVAIQQYSRKCLIDEIVLSNNIEGVHSSRKEIGQALIQLESQSDKKGKRSRFLGLVNKYYKLLYREKIEIENCQDIRELYDEMVLSEVVAEDKSHAPDGKIFRKDQTTIRSATDKVIHIGMTPESKIIAAMEKALLFLKDESIEILYRICIFHYLFEYIHPFYDGNGRLGRFIFSYFLSENLQPLLAYRISETIKENIKEYYDAFIICNDPHNLGDLTPFLIMMLEMIEKASSELIESLERKLITWKRYKDAISQYMNSDNASLMLLYNLLIQAALFSETGISTKELIDNTGISYSTLKKYLNIVESNNLLLSSMEGKEKFYQLNTATLDDIILSL